MMNNLNVKENSKIYVACPANIATGGPELLHQLVYELTKLGRNAFMFYYKCGKENPVHSAYKKYNNRFVDEIDDDTANILIVPEVNTGMIEQYKNIQKVIWWLSVDNYYDRFGSRSWYKRLLKRIFAPIFKQKYSFDPNDGVHHFVQSEYAYQFLKSKNIHQIAYLSDYLNEFFIQEQLENITKEKENIVIYNPKKGIEFTQKLMSEAGDDIQFIPLQDMTREEVAETLSKAKVYIDFGNHPGKDRIPREAAISGCCVITNKQGSAKYFEDVMIDDIYKFEDKPENIGIIIKKIKECFINYDENNEQFNFYRAKIKNEQSVFIEEVKNIFAVDNTRI